VQCPSPGRDGEVSAQNAGGSGPGEALLSVGLENRGATLPTALSSGMRHRLAIAKGLLSLTLCFMLDEPAANVDPFSAADIQLKLFARSQTVTLARPSC
jgi:ABC-type nitrate/sulfonate/bicarbonate transport system ATPase subunit